MMEVNVKAVTSRHQSFFPPGTSVLATDLDWMAYAEPACGRTDMTLSVAYLVLLRLGCWLPVIVLYYYHPNLLQKSGLR